MAMRRDEQEQARQRAEAKRSAVLEAVARQWRLGRTTGAEIARAVGISKPTAMKALRELGLTT